MKVLVVGGGIGGLAVAVLLERRGIDVTLVEQAPEFRHIGFGMTIFSNGRKVLRELGLGDEVSRHGYKVPWIMSADPNGRVIGERINFSSDLAKFGEPSVTIARAVLHDALVKSLLRTKLRLGTKIETFKNTAKGVLVTLHSGEKEEFDLLVAADGIHSHIRETIFGRGESKFYGWSLRFFWAPKDVPVLHGALCLTKEKITLAIYPLKGKSCVGIYEYNPKRDKHQPLDLHDFLPYLSRHGWTHEDIAQVEKEAREGHQYYDHLRHVSLGKWYKKRVVLLGDARHGFSPITGMGASMALEDAFVLADELAKVESTHLDVALKNYSRRRTFHLKKMVALCKMGERFFFITNRFQRWIRNLVSTLFTRPILSQIKKKLEEVVNTPL
ncbi:MAG: FAD-dependent monooxygenase [Patescibacteria group bacterium]|nr:FAD-dependent monooxygenase [Patescibacteria group bacterium]